MGPDPAAISKPSEPDLTVVVVNYNVREFLEQALRSARRAAERVSAETIVVDNNSVDGSVAMVQAQFPEVRLIANERNEGFGAANNRALAVARGRYVLILNPDTIVQEDTFELLVRFMDERPDAGAVGCRILNPDGTFAAESRRAFPTPSVAFFRMTGLARVFPRSRLAGRYNLSFLPPDLESEVDALSGSCMMVRRSALVDTGRAAAHGAAGLFDEAFFMYGEDLDLCYRIQREGWKIWYTPRTQIIHYKGESTKKGEFRYVRLFYGAMVLFTRKHLRSRYSAAFASLVQVAIVLRAAASLVAGGLRRAAAPLADFALFYGVVILLAWLRSEEADARVAPLFFLTVAPAYAAGSSVAIALAGGYRRPSSLRAVVTGVAASFLLVGTASWFIPSIAFSRVVVLASLPVGSAVLVAWRLAWHARRSEPRRAILVGDRAEAARLADLLGVHPRPPFLLYGYVVSDGGRGGDGGGNGGVPAAAPGTNPESLPDGNGPLGAVRHLRDLIRLHRIRDVVFATKVLENRDVFSIMQRLRDLPVEFRMLGEGRSHVIGKASIAELATGDWVTPALRLRSGAARRAFEIPMALLGLVVWPMARLAAGLAGPSGAAHRIASRASRSWSVLTGARFLVGLAAGHAGLVPEEWRLREGVFTVTDTLHDAGADAGDLVRAYGFYVTHQSAALDWDIVFRTLFARAGGI